MKIGLPVIVLLVLGGDLTSARGEFQMPRKVQRMPDFETAKTEAKQQGKPLTFVYTHEKTSCGLATRASLAAVAALGSKTVVVYVDSDNQEWGKLPRLVQEALRSPEAGRFIPKTIVVDASLSKVMAIVPYASSDEYDRLLRLAKKEIVAASTPESPHTQMPVSVGKPAAVIPEDNKRELRTWTTKKGSQLRASLVTEKNGELILKTEPGQLVVISPANLCDVDRQYVTDLKARSRD